MSQPRWAAWPNQSAFIDAAIAVAALGGSLALIAHGGIGPLGPASGRVDLAGVVLAGASTLPIVVWRLSPLGVFAVTGVAGVVLVLFGYRIDLLLGPAVALYLLAASRDRAAPWTRPTTAIVGVLLIAYLAGAGMARGAVPDSELVHTGLGWAVAWFAGERSRLRREQLAELHARALHADREAEGDRLLAVAEERARIARDLHDSAGHAINLIAVRAGAARLRHHQDPDRSLAALEAIEETARQTAAEIDQIVGTLRESSPATDAVAPPAGLASLDTLIGRHRESGLNVTMETTGAPRNLATAVDQAAYRILQEALTNAARHGTGSARVHLHFAEEMLELTVANPVRVGAPPAAAAEGHGLIGMRERATLLGGTLDTERANAVFHVRARLPYGGLAA
jgi:signal transduction histidine kinase